MSKISFQILTVKNILLPFLLLFSLKLVQAQTTSSINWNSDWTYYENNTVNWEDLTNLADGQLINLPHSWNQWDALDITPGYRRDASWYVKQLDLKIQKKQRYFLYFEGANKVAEVYVNGQLAGGHIGGYLGFEIELTPFLKKKNNQIAVRVDNGYNPDVIPSEKADFFIYGGLTRDVFLEMRPMSFIDQVQVSTPQVNKLEAQTKVSLTIKQEDNEALSYFAELIDPAGKVVHKTVPQALNNTQLTFDLEKVTNPQLWSPASPNLYQLKVSLTKDGVLLHQKQVSFGYRWFKFDDYGAFYLNGERLKIRGTHRHEEHAGYGAAMPNSLHRKDIEQIKEMGANFLRLAHYPQDPEVYQACNELGIIVWDELPWCRGGMGGANWEANTMQLLEEQIQQNYNHPSICFWSLGNEIYWLPDFDNGDNPARLNAYLTKLNQTAKSLDPGRLTAIRKYYDGADLVDVFSPSIWSGWYAGIYRNYGNTLEENKDKYPRFLHMEYGGSSHVGRHTEQPLTDIPGLDESNWAEVANQAQIESIAKSGDWSENYMVDLFDWYLNVSESKDWFAGNAQWAFKDFGTPLRPENAIPFLNQKGLMDRAGNPKDAYYVFKSYWSDEPFVYIESKTWTERSGKTGETRFLDVYSNCPEVELWQNGRSLGMKKRNLESFPAMGLRWKVAFAAGQNTLIAKGTTVNGLIFRDTLQVQFHTEPYGKPFQINLDSKPINQDYTLITATMVDKNGRRVLDYENRVYFSCDGDGELLIHYGTPTRSQIIEFANGQASIELKTNGGRSVIEARNQDFKGSYLIIEEN